MCLKSTTSRRTLCFIQLNVAIKISFWELMPKLLRFIAILAGEMMSVAEQFLEEQMHPTVIIGAYRQALEDILGIMKEEIRCESTVMY